MNMYRSSVLLLATIIGSLSSGQLHHKPSLSDKPENYYQRLEEVHLIEKNNRESNTDQKHEPKFGLPLGYGNDLQGYSGSGIVGTYTPLKIDLGGLVLGTVIGLGAVLLAPKFLHLFSSYGGHAPYGRSADVFNEVGNTISQIGGNLKEMDEDSLACLQRVVCTMARYMGTSASQNIYNMARNSLPNIFNGSSTFENTMEVAMKGEDCKNLFKNCSFLSDSENV